MALHWVFDYVQTSWESWRVPHFDAGRNMGSVCTMCIGVLAQVYNIVARSESYLFDLSKSWTFTYRTARSLTNIDKSGLYYQLWIVKCCRLFDRCKNDRIIARIVRTHTSPESYLSSLLHTVFGSITVSISACHAGDRGSIPRQRAVFCFDYIDFSRVFSLMNSRFTQ